MGLQGEAPLGVLLDILNAKMQDADILPAENCLLVPGTINLELITFEK